MADADVQLQLDGPGKLVDCAAISGTPGTVFRQRVSLADDGAYGAHAAVTNAAPAGSAYGLVTRPVNLNLVQQLNLNPASTQEGVSGTFTSAAQDLGDLSAAAGSFSRWRVFLVADQDGTLNLQQSADNVTFYTTFSVPVTASVAVVAESLITLRYLAASYTNGGGSTTTVLVMRAALVAV